MYPHAPLGNDLSVLPNFVFVRLEMAATWVLGVVLIILGSLGNNFGNNLVSLGHKQNKIMDESQIKSGKDDAKKLEEGNANEAGSNELTTGPSDVAKVEAAHKEEEEKGPSSRWRTIGLIIFIVGNLATFAAFGFAAQSLLAALESVQFVSNVVFAKVVHHETITVKMLLSTAMIVGGNVLVVIFSEHHAKLYNSDMLIELYETNTAYHAYLAFAFVLFLAMHFTYVHYYNARVVHKRVLWRHGFVEPFAFSVSAAIMGTQAVLNSKCMSMLIQVSSTGRNEFTRPTIYVILITWILFVAYWLRRLDKGLELFPPLFIIPVLQVFFVFFAILCGGIYFQEFDHFTVVQWVGFVIGVIMILAGVFGLAPAHSVVPELEEIKQDWDAENGLCAPECEMPKVRKTADDDELEVIAALDFKDKPEFFNCTQETDLAKKAKRKIVKRPTGPQIVEIPGFAMLDIPYHLDNNQNNGNDHDGHSHHHNTAAATDPHGNSGTKHSNSNVGNSTNNSNSQLHVTISAGSTHREDEYKALATHDTDSPAVSPENSPSNGNNPLLKNIALI